MPTHDAKLSDGSRRSWLAQGLVDMSRNV